LGNIVKQINLLYKHDEYNTDIPAEILIKFDESKNHENKEIQQEKRRIQRIALILEKDVPVGKMLYMSYYSSETGMSVFSDRTIIELVRSLKNYEPRQRAWYKLAKKDRKFNWTKIYRDELENILFTSCSVSVNSDDQQILGVLGSDIIVPDQTNNVKNQVPGDSAEVFLINKNGEEIILGELNNPVLRLYNNQLKYIIPGIISGETGIKKFKYNKMKKLIAYAPINKLNVSLVIIVSSSDIL
jgi:hypothetical protein